MANDEPLGSPPSPHGSREEKEKNVDKDITLTKAKEASKKFLPGPPFAPTDYEIIGNYLKKRVGGQLSPTNLIRDVDDVFSCSPDKLFRKNKIKTEEEGYFFSPLKGCSHGKCIATDDGFWKYKNTMSTFRDGNGRGTTVGLKRQLRFFENNETVAELETKWVMEEYRILNVLGPAADKPNKVDDIVLRKIYNTDHLKTPENQEEEGEGQAEEGEGEEGEEGEIDDDDIADNDPPNYPPSSAENQQDDDNSGDDTSHDQSFCAENQLDDDAYTFDAQSSPKN